MEEEKTVPVPETKSDKSGCLVAAVIMCLFLFFVFRGCGGSSTSKAPVEPPQVIHTTTKDLLNAYSENEIAADLEYKGKLVEIRGKVVSIGYDMWDTPYISFPDDRPGISLRQVHCYFTKETGKQIANIKKQQFVTVRGIVDGMEISSVALEKCEIVF